MSTAVIIRTRDEAPRLRLTLASLEAQQGLDEVVVVDDGSTDATPEVIAEAAATLPLVGLRNPVPQGRSAASNRGAAAAGADLLIFLDGDTLAAPGTVAAHAAAQAGRSATIARGQTWHLRHTRFLADPETAAFWPHERARESALPPAERSALRVERQRIRDHFGTIAARAAPGVYPGAAPARLHAEEMRALAEHPDSPRLWAAASGSNLSLPRALFLSAGGFDEALDINEHRELALRLCRSGAHVVGVLDARTIHLTHRSGWRDPLTETGWETAFRRRHPEAPLDALKAYWAALSRGGPAPAFFA